MTAIVAGVSSRHMGTTSTHAAGPLVTLCHKPKSYCLDLLRRCRNGHSPKKERLRGTDPNSDEREGDRIIWLKFEADVIPLLQV